MKSITKLNILSSKPAIYISHKGLEAIKHIVSIAPQEAQWFHTIEVKEENKLYLSEEIFIPTQNTSVAQVDSTSSMLIEFYKELSSKYTTEETNHILNNMGCWCHSHHTMGVTPSVQDHNQFVQFINNSIDQDQNTWQIMLIFNKKDEYYCRAYDPVTDIIYEGLDINVIVDYDFNYINEAAKTKFLKPKKNLKPLKGSFWKPTSKGKTYTSTNWLFEDSQMNLSVKDDIDCYTSIAEDVLYDFKSKNIKFTESNIEKFIDSLYVSFTNKEVYLFVEFFKNQSHNVLKLWDECESAFIDDKLEIFSNLHAFVLNKTRSKQSLKNKLVLFLEMLDLNKKELKLRLKGVS